MPSHVLTPRRRQPGGAPSASATHLAVGSRGGGELGEGGVESAGSSGGLVLGWMKTVLAKVVKMGHRGCVQV